MIIRNIKLHNIRSYIDAEIPLEKGTILFEGDIGSGKSTILMAIEFALFGTSDHRFYEKLLRKGSKEGWVEVEFEHGGFVYKVYRSLEKSKGRIKSGESYFITPEGKMYLGPLEIKTKILGLLGVNVSSKKKKTLPIVKYAIYTPQEMMKEILMGSKDERKEVIRKIFKIDEYEIARKNLDIVLSYLRGELRRIEEKKSELDERRRKLEEISEKLKRWKKDRDESLKELERKKRELYEVERTLKLLKEKREKYNQLEKEIEKLNAELEGERREIEKERKKLEEMKVAEKRIREISSDKERYEKLREEKESIAKYVDELHRLEKKEGELRGEVNSIENFIKNREELEKDIISKREKMNELRKKIKKEELEEKKRDADKRREVLQKSLGGLEHELRSLQEELEEYRKLGAVCPKCKRPLSEEYKKKLMEKVKKEIEEKGARLERLRKKMEGVEDELKNLDEELKESRRIEREISLLEGEIRKEEEELKRIKIEAKRGEKLKRELDEIRGKIEKLRSFEERSKEIEKEIKSLEKAWREYNTLVGQVKDKLTLEKSIKERENKIRNLREKIKKCEEGLKKLGYSEEEFSNVEERHKDIFGKVTALRAGIKEIEKNLRDWENMKLEKEKDIKRLEDDISLLEKLQKLQEWLDKKFKPALEEIENKRMIVINEEFRVLFESWFHELLGESDYEATIDEYFEPRIRYEKYDMPISSLSGGERTSVALAYRLSLNTMVKRTLGLESNILILDEPTDGFSKDQLYKLKDVFDKMETDQIIIVTHEKELINIADRVYHVEKVNGESRVTLRNT